MNTSTFNNQSLFALLRVGSVPEINWFATTLENILFPVTNEIGDQKEFQASVGLTNFNSISFDLETRSISVFPGSLQPNILYDVAFLSSQLLEFSQNDLESFPKYCRSRMLLSIRYIASCLKAAIQTRYGDLGVAEIHSIENLISKGENGGDRISYFLENDYFGQQESLSVTDSLQTTLVIPAAGRSSRFPNMKPKWMLTQPNGNLMIVECLNGLSFNHVKKIVIGVLQEHLDNYCNGSIEKLVKCFDGSKAENMVEIVVLPEQTCDQVATVEAIIAAKNIEGPILIKDCDNSFELDSFQNGNGIAFVDVTPDNDDQIYNIASKGFLSCDSRNIVKSVVEKAIISSTFACGAYKFESSAIFSKHAKVCRQIKKGILQGELAISDIIFHMLLSGHVFAGLPCYAYQDWGTLKAWRNYCNSFKTLFIDIDGTLVRNSGEYFDPKWGSTEGLPDNISYIRKLYDTGRVYIILTTARGKNVEKDTIAQLARYNVPYHEILWGLPHASRVVINDYASTNPYPSAKCINLKRNSDELRDLLDM